MIAYIIYESLSLVYYTSKLIVNGVQYFLTSPNPKKIEMDNLNAICNRLEFLEKKIEKLDLAVLVDKYDIRQIDIHE